MLNPRNYSSQPDQSLCKPILKSLLSENVLQNANVKMVSVLNPVADGSISVTSEFRQLADADFDVDADVDATPSKRSTLKRSATPFASTANIDNDTDYRPYSAATMRKHARAARSTSASTPSPPKASVAKSTPVPRVVVVAAAPHHQSSARNARAPARYSYGEDDALRTALAASQRHWKKEPQPVAPPIFPPAAPLVHRPPSTAFTVVNAGGASTPFAFKKPKPLAATGATPPPRFAAPSKPPRPRPQTPSRNAIAASAGPNVVYCRTSGVYSIAKPNRVGNCCSTVDGDSADEAEGGSPTHRRYSSEEFACAICGLRHTQGHMGELFGPMDHTGGLSPDIAESFL